jgi:hypothetical protein
VQVIKRAIRHIYVASRICYTSCLLKVTVPKGEQLAAIDRVPIKTRSAFLVLHLLVSPQKLPLSLLFLCIIL